MRERAFTKAAVKMFFLKRCLVHELSADASVEEEEEGEEGVEEEENDTRGSAKSLCDRLLSLRDSLAGLTDDHRRELVLLDVD